jgi:hypothetical protein
MAEYPRQESSICQNPTENLQGDNQAAQNAAQHRPRTEHAPTPELAKVIDLWATRYGISMTPEAWQAILGIVAGNLT